MRVLVFSHYYYPEGNAPASRMAALCSHWAEQGHEVQVITCAPNVPDGIVYAGYANRLIQTETLNDVHVTRVWTYLAANKGTVGRILNYVSYMIAAALASWFRGRPDVVVATSPQFFCGWAGWLVSRVRIRPVPFVLEIRDMWPDSIVALDAMRNGLLLRFLYRLERWLYAGADHIVTVGEGYWEDLVAKGVPQQKLSIIPNGVDRAIFWPREPNGALVPFGIKDGCTCSYVGTVGMAAGLRVVIEAAERLRSLDRNDIRFLLVGDGAEREELQQLAAEKRLDNVVFCGRMAREEIPNILAASDMCLVHLRKVELFKRVMPSKIFEMAAMKKPIILGVQGRAAQLIHEAHAGVCIEPENAEELIEAVSSLAADPMLRQEYGQSGHDYVIKNFDRAALAKKYLNLLSGLVRRPFPDVPAETVLPMANAADLPATAGATAPAHLPAEKAA